MGSSSSADDVGSPLETTKASLDEAASAVSPALVKRAEGRHPGLGSTVSRYVVLEELGRGGMGRVLRAYDPKLQREVALKELHQGALDGEGAARLVVEARAMAKLSHPHVVSIHDVEEVDAWRVVLVMELVRGTTLRTWLAKQERDWPEVVAMLVQAGHGLAAAHGAGLLHRDFKPGNVLVSEDGIAKVTDFGLAKQAGERSSSGVPSESTVESSSGLTATGMVMGTPRYMAPEQHRAETLTPATDQYAFCVTLWEALCGAPPFTGATMKGLEARKLEPLPAWPRAGVPRAIVEAIARGLSPDPAQRWPSMTALLQALAWDRGRRRSRMLLGSVVAASVAVVSYQAWAQGRAQRCSGAQQQLAGAWDDETRAQVQSAFAAVDEPYAAQAWHRTEQALDGYAREWAAMHTEACEATTVRGEQSPQLMDMRMACLHHAAMELRSTVAVLADADAKVVQRAHVLTGSLRPLSRCADTEALAAAVEPPSPAEAEAVEAAEVRLAEARARLEAGRYAEAKAAVEAARTRLRGVEYGPVQTEVALAEGRVLEKLGDYAASEAALEEALRLAARWRQWESMQRAATSLLLVVGDRQGSMEDALRYRPLAEGLADDDPVADAAFRNDLAIVLVAQGKYAEAEVEHRTALATREASLGPGHPDVAMSRHNLALVLHAQGKSAEAEAESRAALASWEASLGPDHPNVAASRSALGNVLYAQGKYAEAEVEHRAALGAREASLGPDHPDVAMSRNNLAAALHAQGRYADAEVEHRAALASWEASLGPDHPDVAMARNNLAAVLDAQGRHAEAEAEHRAALASWEASLGPDHPDVAASRNNLGNVLHARGKHAEAEAAYRAALASWEVSLGPDHPNVVASRNNLATVLRAQGKYVEAEAGHRAALASWEASLGPDHPNVAHARRNLALTLLALDRAAEALPLAERAWAHHQHDDVSPEPRAEAAFVLARAQWQVAAGSSDHARARSLAEDALRGYREAGSAYLDEADAVRAWLAAHPGG